MAHGVLRRAKSRGKSFIDDGNLGAGMNFGVRKLPAVQNPSSHGLEISREHRNHRGITLSRTPVQSERPADEGRGVERQEFRGARRTNARKLANPAEHFFKVGKLPLIERMGGAVQGNAHGDDAGHVIAAIASHQVDERAPHRYRARQKNHGQHYLCADQDLANQPRAARTTAAPSVKSVNAACVQHGQRAER